MDTGNHSEHFYHRKIVTYAALLVLLTGCADAPNASGYYFTGYVYDGFQSETLRDYLLELIYFDITREAVVDDSGRYFVGPLEQGHDFMIRISADGFRPFSSNNRRYSSGRCSNPCVIQSETFYAYLFSTDVVVPETTFNVYLDDTDERPTGNLRLRPTKTPDFFQGFNSHSSNVVVWENDEDLFNSAITVPVEEGEAVVPEGELIFGVTYDITVYVPGYQYTYGGTFTAGFDEAGDITVSRNENPLQFVFNSVDLGPSQNAIVVLVFDQSVIFDPINPTSYYEEIIDENVTIHTEDADDDGITNHLNVDMDDSIQERGTSISIVENSITLTWSTDGLETIDDDDPITAVTFGGLDQILILSAQSETDSSTSVGMFVGSEVTVDLL